MGEGDIDFEPIPAAIAVAGYRRSVMLEVISPHADRDIARSAQALRRIGFPATV